MHTVYRHVPRIDDFPTRKRAFFPDIIDPVFWELYERCKPYSLVHITAGRHAAF